MLARIPKFAVAEVCGDETAAEELTREDDTYPRFRLGFTWQNKTSNTRLKMATDTVANATKMVRLATSFKQSPNSRLVQN